jgi:hypothetical protein
MIRKLPVLFLCVFPGLLAAQNSERKTYTIQNKRDTIVRKKDLIDVFRSLYDIKPRSDTDRKKKLYFSFLPVSSSIVGPGKALITSTTAGFYMGEKASTNLSSISFTPYFNFKGRYGLPIRSNVWLNNNSWNIQGDTRFLVYPQYTWSLGGNQPESDNFLLNYKYVRFYQSAL